MNEGKRRDLERKNCFQTECQVILETASRTSIMKSRKLLMETLGRGTAA